MVVRGYHIGILAKKTAREVLDDNLLGQSAETAYSFFFGLFPLFLFAAPLISLFGDREEIFMGLLFRVAPNVPPAAFELITGVLKDVVFTDNAPGLISLGAVLALWAGAGMFSGFMSGLNAAYDVRDSRPWWKQKLIAVCVAMLSIALLLSSTTIMVAGEQIIEFASRMLHLGPVGEILWAIVQYTLAFALVVLFIWILYVILPDIHHHRRSAIVGAVFAAILWVLFTMVFRLYVTNFASYNKTYGAIGAVIVLLTWMYWTSFVILAGGELSAEIHAGTGSVSRGDAMLHAGWLAPKHPETLPDTRP